MRAFCMSVLFLLAAAMLLTGCSAHASADRAFSYMEEDFSATVSGSVTRLASDGYTGDAALIGESLYDVSRPFEATVTVKTRVDAAGERFVSALSVTYTAPSSLRGVTVSYTSDGSARAGSARVILTRAVADRGSVREDRTITVDLSATSPAVRDALLAPAGVLLPTGDISAVSPATGGTYTVTRRDGDTEATFEFTKGESLPTRVTWSSPARRVEVTVGGVQAPEG